METADVKWIYDNCPENTPVTVYDDDNPVRSANRRQLKLPTIPVVDPTDDDPQNPYATKTPEIHGASDLTISKGETADLLEGVTAVDTCSNDITDKISVTGNVLTDKVGTYKLTYSVEDTMHRTKELMLPSRYLKLWFSRVF